MPQGNAKNKVRQSKNKQAQAKYAARKATLKAQGKSPQAIKAIPKPRIISIVQGSKPPQPPIKVKGLRKVLVGCTQQTWYMGAARYYTMPMQLVGYVTGTANGMVQVYVPAQGSNPAQVLNASFTFSGLTQYHIAMYLT